MNKNTEILGQDDIIKVDEQQKGFMPHTTFTANDFTSQLVSKIVSSTGYEEFLELEKNGMEANVLVAGKSWRKGKIRLTVEFIPDESSIESSLDEFRNK